MNDQVAKAIAEELDKLGVDVTTAEGREEFRKTFAWSKQQRQRCEKIVGYTIVLIIGGIATMLGGWILNGAKLFFGNTPH